MLSRRWPQIQGIERGDNVTYFFTNAEQIWHRPRRRFSQLSKECE